MIVALLVLILFAILVPRRDASGAGADRRRGADQRCAQILQH
jgi:hypothetical protein